MTSNYIDSIRIEIDGNKNNLTALNTLIAASWVPGQGYRGTMEILTSCILTIVACIYTVIHLNVPTKNGTWPRLVQKIKWTMTGLLAPELVLYTACSQFFEARKLVKELKELQQERNTDNPQVALPKAALFVLRSNLFLAV